MRARMLLVAALAAIVLATGIGHADAPPPQVNEQILATVKGGTLTLTGSDFLGPVSSARSLRFDHQYGPTTVSEAGATSWTNTEIKLTIPSNVRSGTVTVIVDPPDAGPSESAPVPLSVYLLSRTGTETSGQNGNPLALTLGADGTVYINEEFATQMKKATPTNPPVVSAVPIPQNTSQGGIFAQMCYGPPCGVFTPYPGAPTSINEAGEDIEADIDGNIYLTQGGWYWYCGTPEQGGCPGPLPNASRIVKYNPSTKQMSCYLSPIPSAEVLGVTYDASRDMIWYSEAGLGPQAHSISGFKRSTTMSSDCQRLPGHGADPVCVVPMGNNCHTRFSIPTQVANAAHIEMDANGDIWFGEWWTQTLTRLDPDTGVFTSLPMPPPTHNLCICPFGPWEITTAPNGDLWVTEYANATLARIRPSLMGTNDCTVLVAGENPCVERFDVLPATSTWSIHTISAGADGRLWFGASTFGPPTQMIVGFISTQDDNQVVLLPQMSGDAAGIAQNLTTKDVWFNIYLNDELGRLALDDDGDNVPDANDNCVGLANPLQENADRNFIDQSPPYVVDDLTVAMSDNIGDACDPDDDNDGAPDTFEASVPNAYCVTATGPTNSLVGDTDGDRILDLAECGLGSNPNDAASKPASPPAGQDPDNDKLSTLVEVLIGSNPNLADSDGDKLSDGIEYKGYATSPTNVDSDGDGVRDGCEVGSLNTDKIVNAGDQGLLNAEMVRVPPPAKLANMDLNKDGALNSGDQGIMSTIILSGGC